MIRASYQPFTKGQKVWLEGQNLSLSYNKKIMTKREGPFLITEVLGPVNYRLKLLDKWKQRNTVRGTTSASASAPDLPPASAALACHVSQYLTRTDTYLSISVLFIISVSLYISPYPQEDSYPFLFGSPARYVLI